MRVIDAALASHLAGGETTLCNCWRIVRRDGVVLGFTDHDEPLAFGQTVFEPAHGLDGTEVPARLGAQVETSEVLGVLDSAAISEDDILLGHYDGALVETWRVNWSDPAQRVQLRSDTVGEIVREDGVFRAELRSGQQALNLTRGRIYGRLCDAALGDSRCGVDRDAPAWSGAATVIAVDDPFRLVVEGLAGFVPGWFALGQLRWSDGTRAGLTDTILTHDRVGGADVLGFGSRVGDWAVPGDVATAFAGCDRRFATCRQKFANAVNFRGFPHIPGNDFVLRYPREGDALDGRAVVR